MSLTVSKPVIIKIGLAGFARVWDIEPGTTKYPKKGFHTGTVTYDAEVGGLDTFDVLFHVEGVGWYRV